MSIHLKSPGNWRVVVRVNGRRSDRLVRGTRQEAKAEEARLLEAARTAGPASVVGATQTFETFCVELYASAAKNNLKASTWQKRKYVLAQLLRVLGQVPLTLVGGASTVERYKAERLAAGLAKVSINNELRVLRRVLRWAHELGVLPQAVRIPFFKQGKRRNAGAWTAAEVERLLDACRRVSPSIYPMVLFLATTGARRGEAIALPWKHVDLGRGVARIWAIEAVGEEAEWSPKSMDREVPIPDAMLSYLTAPRISDTWVFPSSEKGRYAYWPSLQFDRARDAAGLKGGAHKLRHTYASHFLERNPNLFLLGRVMGHSNTRVTELYSHLVPGYLDGAKNVVTFQVPGTMAADEKPPDGLHVAQDVAQTKAASPSDEEKPL
jgi:integrase